MFAFRNVCLAMLFLSNLKIAFLFVDIKTSFWYDTGNNTQQSLSSSVKCFFLVSVIFLVQRRAERHLRMMHLM